MSILLGVYPFNVNFIRFLWILGRFLLISIKIALGFMKIAALGGDFHESQCDFNRPRIHKIHRFIWILDTFLLILGRFYKVFMDSI